MKGRKFRRAVVRIGQRLTRQGVVGNYEGNISVLDRKNGRLFITPSGKSKELLTERMILMTDRKGNVTEGMRGLRSSSEIGMHVRLYELRPDIGAVVHCHAPFCTAFAVNHTPVVTDALAECAILFGGEIPLLPYGEPGTEHIIDGYEQHLDKNVVLLANHGLLALGKDPEEAYALSVSAELLCKTLFLSRIMGQNVPIPKELQGELSQWHRKQAERTQ